MEEEKSIQHVQLPNRMDLEPKDQLIYLTLKRYDNGCNKCFPSLKILAKKSGAAINTVRDSIERLIEKGYITREKNGRGYKYTFNPYKNFEPFSYDFLDKEDISFTTKAYLCASQQYMFKDIEGLGKISYSNSELSQLINMPKATISKCNRELVRKDYLTILKNHAKDLETNCKTDTKVFELNKFGQAIVWHLCDHEQRIQDTEIAVELLQKELDSYKKLLKHMLEQNKQTIPDEFNM